jgi:hypothetical protein
MVTKLSLCAALLASVMIGPIRAQDSGRATGQAHPPLPAETRYVDYTHVFPEAEHRPSAVEPATLAAIATWLSRYFDLPVADELPRVELVAPSRLVAIRYPALLLQQLQTPALQQAMLDAKRDTLAVYDEPTSTIYLPEGWEGETPAAFSVLVHELVHHLQSRARLRFACPQEREAIAYAAQDRWLSQSGQSLESEFRINPFTLLVRSRCLG